jgi:hypothetical protein
MRRARLRMASTRGGPLEARRQFMSRLDGAPSRSAASVATKRTPAEFSHGATILDPGAHLGLCGQLCRRPGWNGSRCRWLGWRSNVRRRSPVACRNDCCHGRTQQGSRNDFRSPATGAVVWVRLALRVLLHGRWSCENVRGEGFCRCPIPAWSCARIRSVGITPMLPPPTPQSSTTDRSKPSIARSPRLQPNDPGRPQQVSARILHEESR